jgi:bifunctional non-homologous end joining protein LigD
MPVRRRSAPARRTLRQYERKRDFARTPEPPPAPGKRAARDELSFVVQQHAARRLHYDFRLELDGVLKSWAVPKGPSLHPAQKRMAVETEDHPLEYADFEGTIPKGEYGAGSVALWDRGSWQPIGDPHAGLRKGHLEFRLRGQKLGGRWHLIRMRPRPSERGKKSWLLIKARDADARETPRMATSSRLPPRIEPQLATLVDAPPAGAGWLHEIKLDGYRILARIERGKVRLLTRSGNDWTARMPQVAEALPALEVESALLDGEVVALDSEGRSRFQLLQRALREPRAQLRYFVFDLLHLDGSDLRQEPLWSRKQTLRELFTRVRRSKTLQYCEHVEGEGAEVFAEACKIGAEGVVSKQAAAPYRSGRTRSWLKVKCGMRQEFVVVGFTRPAGSRIGLGALLLGVHDDAGALRYCGKVGTGFSHEVLADLRKRLGALEQKKPSVIDPSRGKRGEAHWVKPQLVAEVSFTEWTRDGRVRHPVFIGLRSDKPASAIRVERALPTKRVAKPSPRAGSRRIAAPSERTEVAGVRLSNPGRVYFPDLGVTKSEVAQYYEAMAERAVPALSNRPLSLLRCPDGADAHCFFQKHIRDSVPREVGRVVIEKGEAPYAVVKDLAGIVSLVQIAALELHIWGSRADKIESPDLLVFDLDPDPSVPWRSLADTARLLRVLLAELELVAFLRTTGGKGLHVVVPIQRRPSWDDVKSFTRAVATRLVRELPERFTAQISKQKRKGKILIDYLRNQRGATAIGSYSLRARPGAPVAMPIDWEELDARTGPPVFGIREAPARLAQPDPWRDFEASRRALTAKAVRRLTLS